MMTEQAKVPAIRFAGFTDPWEQRKLGEIASFSKGSGYSKADIRESGIPLFLYGRMYTQYETRVDSVDTFAAPRPGTLYSKGTEIVVPASGESTEDIARASAITREGIALGGDLNVVYPQRMVTPLFLAYGLSHGSSQKLLAQKAQGKTVVHIHASDLKGLGIAFPDVTEQQAIGTFFSSLDDLITLHQRKYDKLVVFKKSMLEKMFPKDGESVPEIRFAGFTDPWEQRKLGEIASFSKGSGYSKADIRESGIPLFLYGRMYTQYETRVDSVDTFAAPRPGTLYSKGTEIVVPASGESTEDIARASAITREGIALGGDLNVVYPQRMVTPLFLAYGLSHGSSQKLLAQKAQGKTVVHIHASDLKGLGIAFPDVTEQQAIGTFFSSLDDLITLHQRKLELLQNIKKSLLDKMFA
ncbi:restriction endonuclease subunit S [Bifidobacterium bifidum]|nr:restriction endonuclease subunit S [Bifidobacterium bifidum]MDB1216256.1 restriction endonuclease subunit S [Bifidobacterium bifidum]MDB1223475.1 restriction endonuclease subunit S [Bifidobacterium bifidum]MDB1225083.1 restriction endonuclease subunit S [Bifidobacterium bifidum]